MKLSQASVAAAGARPAWQGRATASPASRPSTRDRKWMAPAAAATAVAVVRPTAGPQGAARGTAEEAVDPHAAGGAGGAAGINSPCTKSPLNNQMIPGD